MTDPVYDPEADTQPLVPLCEAPDWPLLAVTFAAGCLWTMVVLWVIGLIT